MTITIAIGRNKGMTPMTKAEWKTFKARTLRAVKEFATPVFTGLGDGLYEDVAGTGINEESYVIIAVVDSRAAVQVLKDRLDVVRVAHDQDSIAVVVGHTEMVSPE